MNYRRRIIYWVIFVFVVLSLAYLVAGRAGNRQKTEPQAVVDNNATSPGANAPVPSSSAPLAGKAAVSPTDTAPAVTPPSLLPPSKPQPPPHVSTPAGGPAIFFTDLESGPNTGGENNSGAYVTVYGNNFGSSPVVTVGGGQAIIKLASAPYLWYEKLVVQLGPNAASGNIVVKTSAGSSNGLPFTVRAGNIKCVSTTGSNLNNGNFGTCWATLPYAVATMGAGDTVYVMDGVTQTTVDLYNAAVYPRGSGTAGNPKALLAYPGATVIIGTNSTTRGIRTSGTLSVASGPYWVLAGLTLRGHENIFGGVSNYRIVGNDVSCPEGNGASACIETAGASLLKLYGNYVHDVATTTGTATSKLYHAVYFSTNSNDIDFGWNKIYNSMGCRGVNMHSTNGQPMYGLHIHDNWIERTRCNAVNFTTVNPSVDTVEAYNNLIINPGTGPDPSDGSSFYGCFYTGSGDASIPAGSGVIQVYNNTCYGYGFNTTGASGAIAHSGTYPLVTYNYRNNIFRSTNGGPYVGFGAQYLGGSNNLWYGAGAAPSGFTANVNADPLFVSTAGSDFHLQSGSPAINAGLNTGIARGIDGTARPQAAVYDLGAYE